MFINFSNHASDQWSSAQIEAASEYGEIIDIPFPAVSADASMDEVNILADNCTKQILDMSPCAVMCQGEFTLAFAVISRLTACGIPVLAACSKRDTVEVIENGITQKTAVFKFRQFRQYAPKGCCVRVK